MQRLAEHEWRAREAAHAARIDELTAEYLAWRRRGDRHPVLDFLFDYYGHTPGKLRRWHPGPGVLLEGAADDERAGWTHMQVVDDGVVLDLDSFATARATGIRFARRILARTLERPIQTGCFGLHEWAMVYRQTEGRRHATLPLRLSPEATDAVIDEGTLRCTHFDATRFFTAEALPRNELAPTRDTQEDFEQPGCLHAGMDLYRWALKLAPGLPSELTADAFALAREIRLLDMQASPYDLSALGYEPVAIETAEGRRNYAARQRDFAECGNALRRRMIPAVEALAAMFGRSARSTPLA